MSSRLSLRTSDSCNNVKRNLKINVDFYFEKYLNDYSKKTFYPLQNSFKIKTVSEIKNKTEENKCFDSSFEESIKKALISLKERNYNLEELKRLKEMIINHVKCVEHSRDYAKLGNQKSMWDILSNYFYENEKMGCAFRLIVALDFLRNQLPLNYNEKLFDLNDGGNTHYLNILEIIFNMDLNRVCRVFFMNK